VHGVVLYGYAHGRLHDEVILVGIDAAAESDIEEKLEGALDVVDEFLAPRLDVAQLGDEARSLAVILVRRHERIHLDARLARADLLHQASHRIVKLYEGGFFLLLLSL